ncbi:restriction endonuclease subunit S [Fulvivirga sediminis]|uniref:Restriction endonuclease subunit S n=1 Tax=Fulvivirga sediminis TaxID=2803949 RepID=A0A937JZE4_9BACT|nr:restriction endonuclease subunit S [Fulvivirga sediminis]MBL3655106.1 restriction endonuclease subunit S [Fulvivirga sediminis]
MELPLGYKRTKYGIIPIDWNLFDLQDIVDSKRPISYGIVQTGPPVEDGINCIRVTDLIDGSVSTENLITTSHQISNSYKRTILIEEDIIIALRGKIGQAALVTKKLEGFNLTRGVALIATKKCYSSRFVIQQLTSPHSKALLEKSLNGSALKELSIGVLRKIKISIPNSFKEQQKIAAILNTWDQAISTTQKLIDELKLRNKGLAQQLLTGKKRLKGFDGMWKEQHLEHYFKERKESNHPELPLLSVGEIGVYPQTDSNKKDTSNEDKSKYKRICPGDIGYNTMRMWQGRSALSSLEGIVSPAYTIVTPKKNADAQFFAYLFKLDEVIHKFFRKSQGLVSDTLNCKFKDFKIVKVLTPPSIDEQKAITRVLQKADEELKLYQQQLDTLKEQKKGLMQKLLTGEIRVKPINE